MGARATADGVKEIVSTSLSDDVVEAHCIDTANLYVDTHLLSAGHSNAILEKIEFFLAAHILALAEERGSLKGGKFGDASEFLADVYGQGFKATRFGQLAISLDTSGILAKLGSSNLKAEFRVV